MNSEQTLRIITIISLISSPLGALLIAWGVTKNKINGMKTGMDALYSWKDSQTLVWAQYMINYEREHEKLKGVSITNYSVIAEQLKDIVRRLDRIETHIEKRKG